MALHFVFVYVNREEGNWMAHIYPTWLIQGCPKLATQRHATLHVNQLTACQRVEVLGGTMAPVI